MKLPGPDGSLRTPDGLAETARDAERQGYAGLWTTETAHDPFLPLVLIAEASPTLAIGTAIAVAFARSPMTVAYTAHDLQLLCEGRFQLGLGSQVKPHIERRFAHAVGPARPRGCASSSQALRAIWHAWNDRRAARLPRRVLLRTP